MKMTCVDEIAEANGEEEWISWKDKVIDSMDEIAAFVARRRKGGNAERIVHYYRGSFNTCIHIKFKDAGPDAIIRLAKAGVTAFRDEKVEKEVQVMRFLSQNTTIDNKDSNNSRSNLTALDYRPSLIFDNDTTGNEAAKRFAEHYLLPFFHEDLQPLANMVRPVPDFLRPGIEFCHVLGGDTADAIIGGVWSFEI
jgi:hypothetical protein